MRRTPRNVWTFTSAWKISAALFVLAFVLSTRPNLAQEIRDNSGYIPFQQAFFAFEVESPLQSLKETAIWDELEQMLDDPYAFALDPSVGGNVQGWPSYRLTQPRRRSFIYRDGGGNPCAPGSGGCTEVPLAGHVIHPLNYNHMNGEELRLLNPHFESAEWIIPDQLSEQQEDGTYQWLYKTITVSDGEDRIEEDEAALDFNSPVAPDNPACITTTEFSYTGGAGEFFSTGPASGVGSIDPGAVQLAEGIVVCGGDPGEPGYAGFGVLLTDAEGQAEQYSVPAVPGIFSPADTFNPATHRLYDPERGFIQARTDGTAGDQNHGLRRPSLRVYPYGFPNNPNYLVNRIETLEDDPSALAPSNENDYYRGANRAAKVTARTEAAALGKALFWDMQVGSDAVQACASCHFSAGADNRTKNQTNPNHLGGDLTLQVHPNTTAGQNSDLVASDFPFQVAQDGPGINDVASSMGVRFRLFTDIKAPGPASFSSCAGGDMTCVRTLLPDNGNAVADPIPLFQGLRRVEPRNTPTLFNADMNFDNFWDGRARHDFNGGSVFGASDPQHHVFVSGPGSFDLTPTRQIIRFVSIASLATGPALSEFEMSFAGRNWAKIGKKLLQGNGMASNLRGTVTPLANQLVSTSDSVLGIYSNQGGTACAGLTAAQRVSGWMGTAPNKPGLCISYPELIRRAYYPALWNSAQAHIHGCYTNGQNTPACNGSPDYPIPDIPVLVNGTTLDESNHTDPFDGYALQAHMDGPPNMNDTNEFSQMEANMSLFFGLSLHAWAAMLVTDDAPFDRFMDANPESFKTFGESDEPNLALDLLRCDQTGGQQPCFVELGNFKRDPNVEAKIDCVGPNECTSVPSGGTRTAGTVDPLMGVDFFLGSNMSLKNPNFRSLRCGECHAAGTLTDHTMEISHQISFGDFIQEFVTGTPGLELFPEPLGGNRVISGFSLEGEINGSAQDAIERNVADFCAVEPCVDAYGEPTPGGVVGGFPQGQALFDNGVYNIGVTPIGNDIMRGGTDAFGWPLSLARLAMKNLGGVDYTPGGDDPGNGFAQPGGGGNPLPTFDPNVDPTSGGLFGETSQDQQINAGFEEEPEEPLLPPYLAPWASNIPVGDETNQDELFFALNTTMREPMLEGFVDNFGPFNPAAVVGESFNYTRQPEMSAWPNVNRVNAEGSVKAPSLRNVARTGPYFHNGGKLTLRQVLDFYTRGGDFPKTNAQHRDFLIVNLLEEDEALGGLDPITGEPEFTAAEKEEILVSVIDFLLELTDERVDFQRAPFDQVEVFVPLDGTAPDNGSLAGAVTAGRPGFLNNLANGMFLRVPPTGQEGKNTPTPNFLGLASGPRLVGGAASCGTANNHYCH